VNPGGSAVSALTDVPWLCGGEWALGKSGRWGEVFNPSIGRAISRVPLCDAAEADRAVQAAAAALPAWSDCPVVDRARIMFRFRELLVREKEGLARLVTREHGKTLTEARASVERGIEMVEFACGIPSLIMGQCVQNIAANVDCETIRHPVGVCVGITPFNFPVMVPPVDDPGRPHLRQHVRAQTVRARPLVGRAAG